MITSYSRGIDLVGVAADTIPDNIPNGSRFHEIDTGKVYMYDADGEKWYDASGNERGGGDD